MLCVTFTFQLGELKGLPPSVNGGCFYPPVRMVRGHTRICGSDALLFVCYKLDLTHICHSNAPHTEKHQSVTTHKCASIKITHLFLKITCQILVGGGKKICRHLVNHEIVHFSGSRSV